jgi:nitronate monooxygenase
MLDLDKAPPRVIQGGMGIGVSDWRLARAVARTGQLGVVSGACLDVLLARRLEDGDPDGALRRALAACPIPGAAEAFLAGHFRPDGRRAGEPYRARRPLCNPPAFEQERDLAAAAFVETFLAREGHAGPVGINLLTKVQLPTLPTLYGAMLAGIDAVLMGAGIPREIPGALDRLARHEPVAVRFDVAGATRDDVDEVRFDPRGLRGNADLPLSRPRFFAIVSSHALATLLARKASGRVDGFVVEGPTAGGHNAPPRGGARECGGGAPAYGERDRVDYGVLRELGRPFWIAGGAGSPEGLARARSLGAAGVQVGTLFAFCAESGLAPDLRRSALDAARNDALEIVTDARASPTGYPFKIVVRRDAAPAPERKRRCDLGYLRAAYRTPDGGTGYRCPGEPIAAYLAKGGEESETCGKRCLCNELLATVGRGQTRRDGSVEQPLLTAGDAVRDLGAFLAGRTDYAADDVLRYLLAPSADVLPPA